MSRVDAIRARQAHTDENFDKTFQSQAELDRAYLLAKVKQWKRIVIRVTNERNTAEARNAALEADLKQARVKLAAMESLVEDWSKEIERLDQLVYFQLIIEAIRAALGVDAQNEWVDSPLPGGYVCATCGMPTESEPCPTHQPAAYRSMQ